MSDDSTGDLAKDLFTRVVALPLEVQAQYLAEQDVPDVVRAKTQTLLDEFTAERKAREQAEAKAAVNLLRQALGATTMAEGDSPLPSSVAWAELEEIAVRQYPRQRELGRGGMGIVYEVWDPAVNRPLAMKVLRTPGSPGSAGSLSRHEARFLKEARITGQLDHPGVVPVHEIGNDKDGNVFFTMQVVAGMSLREILAQDQEQRDDEGWTTTRLLSILLNVCETLAYAHSKGIIHRDLKPDNIMVGQFGETYVMDWGLAKHIDSSEPELEETSVETAELTQAGAIMGTPRFMSPEQASGNIDNLHFDCDVYQVGAILYNILSGAAPYSDSQLKSSHDLIEALLSRPPTSLEHLAPQVPAELVAICEKAMEREHTRRYRSMAAMGDDLRAYLEQRVVSAYRTGALAELKKWVVRNRGVAIAAGAATATAIVAFTVVSVIQSERNTELRQHAEELTTEQAKTKLALEKEQEANRHVRSLVHADASAHILDEDPATALLLALEAAMLERNSVVQTAILRALDSSRELRTLAGIGKQAPKLTSFSPDGNRIMTAVRGTHRILIMDAATGVRLAMCIGHTGPVRHASFSPDGTRIASASWDGTTILWDAANGRILEEIAPRTGQRGFASFSPDGTQLAFGALNGIALWDSTSGLARDLPISPPAEVLNAAFSPDGSQLIAGCADGTARLFDLKSEVQLCVLAGHQGNVDHMGFSPNGATILTVSSRPSQEVSATATKRCHLWTSAGKSLFEFAHGAARIEAAVSCSGGSRIVTAASDRRARIWSAETGKLVQALPSKEDLLHLDVDPSGTFIATAGQGGVARLWDIRGNSLVAELRGHDQEIRTVRFDHSGKRLLTSSDDGTIRIWRVNRKGPLDFLADSGPISAAQFHPESDRILTLAKDRPEVSLWAISGREKILDLRLDAPAVAAFFYDQGERLITREVAGQVRLWNTTTGSSLGRIPMTSTGGGIPPGIRPSGDGRFLLVNRPGQGAERWLLDKHSLDRRIPSPALFTEFSSDGRRLIEKTSEGIRLWDVDLAIPIATPLASADGSAKFSPNGKLLTWPHKTMGPDGNAIAHGLNLWDAESGTLLTSFAGHQKAVYGPEFDPSGDWLVTPSLDGLAKLWNTRNGTLRSTLSGHRGAVNSAWITQEGRRIVTRCFDDRSTRLWDGANAAQVAVLGGEERRVNDTSLSSSGRYLVTVINNDSEALLWSSEDGELIASLPGRDGPITHAAFSPDENWVLTLSNQGAARLWPVDIVGVASQLAPRVLMPNELELYNIGTAAERASSKGSWIIRHHLETLHLLQNASTGEDSLARLKLAYWEAVRAISEALETADAAARREGKANLVASLETLGRGDAVAHFEIARIQVALEDYPGARATIAKARTLPGNNEDLEHALNALHQELPPAAP